MNRELLVLLSVNCEITFEYDDDSSGDNDSALEQDSAEPQLLFLVKREMWNGQFIFQETWSIPIPTPFTTLFWTNFGKLENALQSNPYFERRWAWEKGF